MTHDRAKTASREMTKFLGKILFYEFKESLELRMKNHTCYRQTGNKVRGFNFKVFSINKD